MNKNCRLVKFTNDCQYIDNGIQRIRLLDRKDIVDYIFNTDNPYIIEQINYSGAIIDIPFVQGSQPEYISERKNDLSSIVHTLECKIGGINGNAIQNINTAITNDYVVLMTNTNNTTFVFGIDVSSKVNVIYSIKDSTIATITITSDAKEYFYELSQDAIINAVVLTEYTPDYSNAYCETIEVQKVIIDVLIDFTQGYCERMEAPKVTANYNIDQINAYCERMDYALNPSTSKVIKNADNTYTPDKISCNIILTYDNQSEIIGVDNKIMYPGRNLIPNSNSFGNAWRGGNGKYLITNWDGEDKGLTYIEKGKTYTITARLWVDEEAVSDTNFKGITFYVSGLYPLNKYYKNTAPTIIKLTFIAPETGFLAAYHYPETSAGNSYIDWACLVEGDHAPDEWSFAPEDMKITHNNILYAANTEIEIITDDRHIWRLIDPQGDKIDEKHTIITT